MFTTKLHCNYGHKYIYIYVKITSKDVKNEKKRKQRTLFQVLKAKKKGHPCLRLFLRARQLFARVLHYVSLPWWILFDRLILRALVRGTCSKFQRNKRVWTTNRVIGCSRFSRVWVNRSRNLAMITSLPRLRDHKANVGDIVPRLAADRRKKVRYIVPCWEECQALGLGMKYTCKSPLQNASGSWLNHLLKVRQQTRERVRRYIIWCNEGKCSL